MVNKKMMKRLSALLLTATLCISACPTNVAYATEMTETEEVQNENAELVEQDELVTSEVDALAETGELTDETEITQIHIPDAVLYQYLLKEYDKVADAKLTYAELKEVEFFSYTVTEEQPAIGSFKNPDLYCPNITTMRYGIDDCNTTKRFIITQESMAELKQMQEGKDYFNLSLYGVEMT